VIGAGGTGGHVYPALALGLEMRELGLDVVWVGREAGLEQQVAVEHGFAFEPLAAAGFFGRSLVAKVAATALLGRGLFRTLALMRRVAPIGVVASGGFASAALLAAAWVTGVPFFLLEQNCVPGRVTRCFAPGAKESFLAFPTTRPFPGSHVVTGSPLRRAVVQTRRQDDGRTVLFIGGSQGAQALNLAAIDTAAALTNLRVIILTGRADYDFVRARIRSRNCEPVPFTSHPEELYRQATMAVSRAGGMVLSELLALALPAILVPFPYATDRHQQANAEYLESLGAALVLEQNRLSGLTSLIRTLMDDKLRRSRMEAAARAAAQPEAARAIARRVAEKLRNDQRAMLSRKRQPSTADREC